MPPSSDVAPGQAVAESLRERRLFRRYGLGLEGRLLAGDRAVDCVIHDLSLGGAGLSPALPELASQTLRLQWDGLAVPDGVRCRVVRTTDRHTHLMFELDEDAEDALTMFLLTRAPTLG